MKPAPGSQPRPLVFGLHILATALLAAGHAGYALGNFLPIIARKQFDAGDWQTTLITAAGPTLLISSIFWNELLSRISLRRYLLVHWLTAMLPVAFIGLARDYGQLLILHLIAAVGAAGWSPIFGTILKTLYADAVRGRVMGVISAINLIGSMVASYIAGSMLAADDESFRTILPASAVLAAVGVGLLSILCPGGGTPAGSRAAAAPLRWSSLIAPILSMNRVLRADRAFLRYEQAFMTYGVGWMICTALMPVFVTHGLSLRYDQIAGSVMIAFQLAMLIAVIPMGWMLDRLGAARTCAISFAGLALYPLALLLASGPGSLAIASVWYGIVMAGVQQGWMLGPVTLAGRPERVASYVAIHATLVGIRGTLAQVLGMALYSITGGFTWPLLIAAAAFAWAGFQMKDLHRWQTARDRRDAANDPQSAQGSGPRPESSAAIVQVEV